VREGYQMDYVFDWTLKRIHETIHEQQQGQSGTPAAAQAGSPAQ
jgi:casein kinase 1